MVSYKLSLLSNAWMKCLLRKVSMPAPWVGARPSVLSFRDRVSSGSGLCWFTTVIRRARPLSFSFFKCKTEIIFPKRLL